MTEPPRQDAPPPNPYEQEAAEERERQATNYRKKPNEDEKMK